MDTIDFKGLWSKQQTTAPDMQDLMKRIHQFRRKNTTRIIIGNVCMLATTAFIFWVWVRYQPELITTKIGIVLCALAMMMFLFFLNKIFRLYSAIRTDLPNSEYLSRMLEIRERTKFLQTRVMSAYFVILSTGIGLYMIEYALRMTTFWGIFYYGLTMGWIAFAWFVLRPMKIRKEMKKMDDIIQRFEAVNRQMANGDNA